MDLDLSDYDLIECQKCLTSRDITRHADLYVLAYPCDDNRALVVHLLGIAAELMTAAQTLMRLFLTDGHDLSHDTHQGLTQAQRHQVLTLASTCAYNATLFVQEAQHRRIRRTAMGWDPITTPITA